MADAKQPEERSETGTKPGPRRQCAGCAKRDSADDLLRIVLGEQGELAVDLADSRFGRGSHVHASKECMQKALRGGFAKVFKTGSARVEGTVESIGEQIVIAADRRIEGLLAGARRGKLAIAGADTVREAYREGNAALVVVACDAAAATKHPEIQEAVAEGKAIAWGNKQRLGAIFGRDETAVCAVLHEGVAKAIKSARQQALSFAGGAARSEAWWSSEDR